jgi:hypothetical protein
MLLTTLPARPQLWHLLAVFLVCFSFTTGTTVCDPGEVLPAGPRPVLLRPLPCTVLRLSPCAAKASALHCVRARPCAASQPSCKAGDVMPPSSRNPCGCSGWGGHAAHNTASLGNVVLPCCLLAFASFTRRSICPQTLQCQAPPRMPHPCAGQSLQ